MDFLLNLPIGAMISGGFALVLVLSVVIGLAGVLAVMSLNGRMELTAESTEAVNQLQKISAAREAYMQQHTPELLKAVETETTELERQLSQMAQNADAVQSESGIRKAEQSVASLAEGFAKMTRIIDERNETLTDFLDQSTALDTAASAFSQSIQQVRHQIDKELATNQAELQRVDTLARLTSRTIENLLLVQRYFSGSA
ncbi:hypothetical protein [Breoghania sp.]|uniref:hypothetical protein n=1 Tax=Breoghania sp. TaxID=2065378 RepID=UPI0026050A90|nr:hypothetical protein [Breoghania sp.]MDJ0929986.1 hypothetical protein [Breoghania sp.]